VYIIPKETNVIATNSN